MRRLIQSSLGPSFRIATLDAQITELGGLDRYERLAWRFEPAGQHTVLHVDALPKKYGPPFLFFGASLENTTGNEFRFSLAGRYLSYDVLGSGTETRLDATIGSDPGARGWPGTGRSAARRCSSNRTPASKLKRSVSSRTIARSRPTARRGRRSGPTLASTSAGSTMFASGSIGRDSARRCGLAIRICQRFKGSRKWPLCDGRMMARTARSSPRAESSGRPRRATSWTRRKFTGREALS